MSELLLHCILRSTLVVIDRQRESGKNGIYTIPVETASNGIDNV